MKLLICDANNLFYRALHGIKANLKTSNNLESGTIFGFFQTLFSHTLALEPTHIVVCWDHGKNWRHKLYPEYKANRKPNQVDVSVVDASRDAIHEGLKALGICALRQRGYEADDIIAKLSTLDGDIWILSGDHDFQQLLSDSVHIINPATNLEVTCKQAETKYGVPVSRFADLWALTGDKSDNIIGIHGVGPKRGSALVNSYAWGELLDCDEVKPHRNEVALNRALIALDLNTTVRVPDMSEMEWKFSNIDLTDGSPALKFFQHFEFTKLLKQLKDAQ